MPYYESVFIARQDVTAAQVEALTLDVSKLIEEQGGKVAKVEQWGLRGLAYKIKKNRKGHYVLLNIDAPPQAITEMERQLRLNEDVLRQLTVRVDELEEGPTFMMQNRGSRDERPRRSYGGEDKTPDVGDAAGEAPGEAPKEAPEEAAGTPDDETAEGDEK